MTPKAYIEYSNDDVWRTMKPGLKKYPRDGHHFRVTDKAGKRTCETPDEAFLRRHQTSITSFSLEPVILSIFLIYVSVSA